MGGSSTPEEEHDSFDSLLKQAARISQVAPASSLTPGRTLADGRLRVSKRLGEGGMGVVYEAFDDERREAVALKTLTRLSAANIYRLKNEFRALSDVRHPNLVGLQELFVEGELWFFTMDLVAGMRLDAWLRDHPRRLRSALAQLVAGVEAIHAAGKLHRDLKPTNVLVTAEGRVVVLDFGLAVDPEVGGVGQTVADDAVSGTPAYMAPEQAAGSPARAASDFYAIGVMLFEALTGRLPFDGQTGVILAEKQTLEAPRVRDLRPDAPDDLDALCAALLSRDPGARPDAAALGEALGVTTLDRTDSSRRRSSDAAQREANAAEAAVELLGRESELAALCDAFEATLAGQSVVMFVRGESGMGKSALCEAFAQRLRSEGRAKVLSGRCYERENVPFKGFDSLMDDLSRHLRRLPRDEAAALLPREVRALSRLFPALARVEVVEASPERPIDDPLELRRRAYAAFGELLARMCDRAPLCVHLDDVQWLDTDAVLFMRALMVHPEPVPALLLLSHRSEGAENNHALSRVRDAIEGNRRLQLRTLEVTPLSPAAARDLATNLLTDMAPQARDAAEAIARESGGSPFFVGELARFAARHDGDEAALSKLSLQNALGDHLHALPPLSRRLLEHSALAGAPLPVEVLLQASQATHADLDALRAAHLLRLSRLDERPLLECYHDKVRENVTAGLSELQRVSVSATLAAALEAHPGIDPELLARCYEGAGQSDKAATHYVRAAEQAMTGTAFLHAAELYERAVALGHFEAARAHALRVAHGNALAYAGRGKQAAETYLRAAADAEGEEQFELRRRAAEQLFTTGHVEEGMALFRELFDELGMSLPTPAAAIRRLLISQLWLRIRGTRDRRRERTEAASKTLRKLDVLRSSIDGIVSHNPIVAASVADRYLLDALDAGVANHAAQALGYQAYFLSFALPHAEARITHLLESAVRVASELDDPALNGRVEWVHGAACFHRGLWSAARQSLTEGARILRTVHGADWDLDVTQLYGQMAAFFQGDFSEIARSTPGAIEQGFSRDRNWVGVMMSGVCGAAAWLTSDDARGYERALTIAGARWRPLPEIQWPDYFLALGQTTLAMYRGDPVEASERLEQAWPAMARSLVARSDIGETFASHFRGTAALSRFRRTDSREARAIVNDCRRRLKRLHLASAPASVRLLDAGLALQADNAERAADHLRMAIAGFDACDMALFAAAARRRLGQLLGGDEGAALLAEGDAAMGAQHIVDLDAMTEMLCAGCRPQ